MRNNREIFKSPGIPQDPDKSQANQGLIDSGEYRIPLEDGAFVELGPKLPESFSARVNWKLLRSEFETIATRCGVNPETLNFLGPDRIFTEIRKNEFNARENLIFLDHDVFYRPSVYSRQVYGSFFMGRLAILIHEETHAVGQVLAIDSNSPDKERGASDPLVYDQGGYGRYFNGILTKTNFLPSKEGQKVKGYLFVGLMEGVTEKIALQVLNSYVEQDTTISLEQKRIFKEQQLYILRSIPYRLPVQFVDALIGRLSRHTGLLEKTVWEAIVRGHFEGEDFEDQSLSEAFAEAVSPQFLYTLSKASSNMDDVMNGGDSRRILEDLIEELDKDLPPDSILRQKYRNKEIDAAQPPREYPEEIVEDNAMTRDDIYGEESIDWSKYDDFPDK